MAVSVFRDHRELERSAIKQHSGLADGLDFGIARFSENADLAHVVPGGKYHTICLVERGAMIRLDRKEPILHPGKIVIDPNWFGGTFTNDQQTDWICAYVSAACFDQVCREHTDQDRVTHLDRLAGVADPHIATLIRSCAASLLGSETSRLELDAWAQIFASYLFRTTAFSAMPSAAGAKLSERELKMLVQLIEDDLAEDVSLGALSERLKIGKTRLSRGFRDATGVSIHQYVLSRRIEEARALIDETHSSLSEIAYETGFSSQSHLTTVFRRRFGVTPGKYRSQNG